MGMTPELFFNTFVEGNYDDYAAHPDDARRAFNVAVAASHLADHCYAFWTLHDHSMISNYPQLRDYLDYAARSTEGRFWHIRGLANAYKHLYVTEVKADIDSAGRLSVEMINAPGDDCVSGLDHAWDAGFALVYTTRDGQRFLFTETIDEVMRFWREEFESC